MGVEGLQCHGCGSTNVEFDPRMRKVICNTCGKEEFYSRATLNANGKVVLSKQNAMKFFAEGKIENAQRYAMDVLNISMDNVPALYILAYYEEFTVKRYDAMKNFFADAKEIALEYDEREELKTLLLSSVYRLMDFEQDIIELIAKNSLAEEDTAGLCEFFDQICHI